MLTSTTASAPLGGRQPAETAVGRKDPMEAGQNDPRFRHQDRQPGDEIEGFEDDVRRAVAVSGL